MPAFNYEAINSRGKSVRGVIDGDSAKSVRSELRSQNLVPVFINEVSLGDEYQRGKYWNIVASRKKLNNNQLTVWTRQIASLISAGLQVDKALYNIANDAENANTAELMANLISQVKSGVALSTALKDNHETFDNVYCSVVAAGEKSGRLGAVLSNLAEDMEAFQALKSKIISAALYPAIVSCLGFIIVIFLMTYVLPQIAGSFTSSKQDLPLITLIMLNISGFIKEYFLILIVFLMMVSSLFIIFFIKNSDFRLVVDSYCLKLPLVGKLVRDYNSARFARTLGLLVIAGVPILEALKISSNSLSNTAMKIEAESLIMQVREGASLGVALSLKKTFPMILSSFAKIGIETGKLGEMLTKVGEQISNDLQRKSMQLASVLEPILITIMGVFVMCIVISILMPIIEMNSFVN